MARACFYCGAEATAREHGIPPWAPPLVGLEGAPVEHLVADGLPRPRRPAEHPADQLPYSLPAHAEIGERQPAVRLREAIDEAIRERVDLDVDAYSARALCAACAPALADLDTRALPILRPMVDGSGATLDEDAQRLAAAWAARAAYAVLAVERKAQGVPKSHRRVLRADERPHDNVFIGFGRYRRNHVGVLAGRLLTPLRDDGAPVEAYTVLLVLGHLVVKVFGIHRWPAGIRVQSPDGQLVRIWPAREEAAAWPPLWGLSEQTLEHAFLYEPFYRPFEYGQVKYLGPGRKIKTRRKRTEGLRGRQ